MHAGYNLHVTASGECHFFGSVGSDYCYPEGRYSGGLQTGTYNPSACDVSLASICGDPDPRWATPNCRAMSLAMYIGGSSAPSPGAGGTPCDPLTYQGFSVSGCLQPNRDSTYLSTPAGKVWMMFNDVNYSDNAGSFATTLTQYGIVATTAVQMKVSPNACSEHQLYKISFPWGYFPLPMPFITTNKYFSLVSSNSGLLTVIDANNVIRCYDGSGELAAQDARISEISIWTYPCYGS